MLTSILPFMNAMLPALTMVTMGQAYYHGSGSIARYKANQSKRRKLARAIQGRRKGVKCQGRYKHKLHFHKVQQWHNLLCGPWYNGRTATSDVQYFKSKRNKCKRCSRALKKSKVS